MLLLITLGTILTVLIYMAIIGVIVWLIFYLIPMPVLWRRIIGAVLGILLLLWLLQHFGNTRF